VELQHALTMLDQDHDQLAREADKKDETIATLTSELERKVTSLEESQAELVQLHLELGRAGTVRKDKEMEVCEVQGNLNIAKTQLMAAQQQVEDLTRKMNELRSDLNTMTHVSTTWLVTS